MEEKKGKFIHKLFGLNQELEEKKESKADEIIKDEYIKENKCGPDGCNLVIESMQANIESYYYWFYNFLKTRTISGLNIKEGNIIKIRDVFSASEASSFWGAQEQRKGIQQDKVSQYMATIGKMIKDIFQIIRELRIIDERLVLYDEYNQYSKGDKDKSSGAVALKGTWIDLVEGGTKNPASVYGLASQVGFATLPDFFFIVHPKTIDDVDKEVSKLAGQGINRKVREVLGRKLKQFVIWKEKTEREIRDRKNFILKYLRMHFNNIKLYINWVKPYLKAVKQLQSKNTFYNPALGSSFESTQIELELLAYGDSYSLPSEDGTFEETFEFKKYFPSVIIKFNHVVMPQMAFQKEFQRGPIHSGRTEITIKPYFLTKEQMDKYKAAKDREAFEEIEDLIPSLEDSLNAIGPELEKYLKEAEGVKEEKKEKSKKQDSIFTPFTSIFKIGNLFSKSSSKEERPLSHKKENIEKEAAKSTAIIWAYVLYDVFKRTHRMLAP